MPNDFASNKLHASYGSRALAERVVFNIVNTGGRLRCRMFKNIVSRNRQRLRTG